ncbi:Origin recognition complex subunit 4 [Ceratocystis lukuohia]|uniref:Origin recognition complex subunit 4 n=1 Tax=Ceratocystis lukuohia TaxID=2019550 RepID=A0ABR4MMW2_9PEZI
MDQTPTTNRKRGRSSAATATPTSTSKAPPKRRRLNDENTSPIKIEPGTGLYSFDSFGIATKTVPCEQAISYNTALQAKAPLSNANPLDGQQLVLSPSKPPPAAKRRGRPPKAKAALQPQPQLQPWPVLQPPQQSVVPLPQIPHHGALPLHLDQQRQMQQQQQQQQHQQQQQQPSSFSNELQFVNISPQKYMAPASPIKSPLKSPLKGILTPSRHRGPLAERTRKNVVFDMGGGNKTPGEVVFEDLPGTNSGKRGKPQTPMALPRAAGDDRTPLSEKLRAAAKQAAQKKMAAEAEMEPLPAEEEQDEEEPPTTLRGHDLEGASPEEIDEDEEKCQICGQHDSEAPNEILFCDVCDLGYHQQCHGVSTIPDGDWLCLNCAQEDVTKTPSTKRYAKFTGLDVLVSEEPEATIQEPKFEVPPIPNFEHHLRCFQRVLVDRCTGRRRIKLIGHEEPWEKTHQLIEQTVAAGEGNSMLVIGARGSGKTTMVESIVDEMHEQHTDKFHVVRLNGFVHTDDKLALKEIWRQLGVEMEVDEAVMKRTSYSDTLASLLALLSHPTEISGPEAEGVTSKSVIFVIDEFDMFAYHPRQTLLYNLFDIAQSRKAPIGVIGCTTRLDVVEMLEKRVKSRFSHRYVYMTPARSLPAFWDVCRQGLVVDEDDAVKEGLDPASNGFAAFQSFWTDMVGQLHEQPEFQKFLKHHFYTAKSVPAFLATCILPLSLMQPATLPLRIPTTAVSTSSSNYTITPNAVVGSVSLSAPPSKAHILESLSDLDLSLLIAAARLDIVAHTDTVNFAMAYDEYTALVSKQRVQAGMLALGGGARVWGRGVAGIAWERLVSAGLLVPATVGGVGQMGGLESKMWKVDMALEDIPVGAKLSAPLAKWCREV